MGILENEVLTACIPSGSNFPSDYLTPLHLSLSIPLPVAYHFFSKGDLLFCHLPYCSQHCFVYIASESKHKGKKSEQHKQSQIMFASAKFPEV